MKDRDLYAEEDKLLRVLARHYCERCKTREDETHLDFRLAYFSEQDRVMVLCSDCYRYIYARKLL